MEHETIWEKGFGICAIRVCSCGAHYLIIGKACLLMDAAHLDQVKALMGDWKGLPDRGGEVAGVFQACGHKRKFLMEPWLGPVTEKLPCVN